MSKDYTNMDKGQEIAIKLKIDLPEKWGTRAIRHREIAKKYIPYFKKKKNKRTGKYDTYCGQYTSKVLQECGFDIGPLLCNKGYLDVNTSMQYANALKYKVKEVTAEEAHYLACVGRMVLVLSPHGMQTPGHNWNHAAITWPMFREHYDERKGPAISQQGWTSLCPGHVLDKAAWGIAWKYIQKTNQPELWIVKYFLPDLR